MKNGWGLVEKKDALWARVIRAKYNCGSDLLPRVERKNKSSNLWKGICLAWKGVEKNHIWRHWDENKLKEWLPDPIVGKIRALSPPSPWKGHDSVAWAPTSDGTFSLKSAYNSLHDEHNDPDKIFKLIWKLNAGCVFETRKVKKFLKPTNCAFLTINCVKKIELVEAEVMEGVANFEVIPNTHEGVTFVCECPLSFAIPCTMSFVEFHISKRVSNILYRNHVQVFDGLIQFQMMHITDDASMQQILCIYQQTRFHVPMIELYVEFEQQSGLGAVSEEVNVDELENIDWEEDNNDSEEEFEANYEVDDENDDGDLAGNLAVQNEVNAIVSQHSFGVPSFMRTLDLEAMHAPKFPEYANTGEGNAAAEDGEFSVRMKFGSRDSVISKSYIISREIDYTVYESEPQAFYAKCKGK
ncbi:hypothetical protein Ahy_B08g089956 [Arachis hypogaea]|uniref:Uncharacterized protein n=1 Tax=Arachis hypogaea TaxID=3818 RepID=A0A444XZ60_ARAHY|nr:hypothetical protein Ahy_B08g089956 [Arachis hypogaea]